MLKINTNFSSVVRAENSDTELRLTEDEVLAQVCGPSHYPYVN